MDINIIERLSDGQPALVLSADGRYRWFWGQDGFLVDTVADRAIYQMRYMRRTELGSDPLPDDVAEDARAFWAALFAEKDRAARVWREKELAELHAEAEAVAYRPEVTGAERARQERAYDNLHNEGGEGYNPWRDL